MIGLRKSAKILFSEKSDKKLLTNARGGCNFALEWVLCAHLN